MDHRLSQQQQQRQILSPQIRQYLKLLQMPLVELTQAIEAELAENPMLEEVAPVQSKESAAETAEAASQENKTGELDFDNSFQHFEELDENFREGMADSDAAGADHREIQRKINFQESLITKPETLHDFLLWQVRFMELNEEETRTAEEIIGNVNEEGYLKASIEEIAKSAKSSPDKVETLLHKIQQLEPPGIAARSLQEALKLQLQRKGPEASLALEIVSNHLPLLEKRDWKHLAKVLAVGPEQIKEAAVIIAHLEPKPGRTYYAEEPIAVTPDASVSFTDDENGPKLKIDIHDESLPELHLNAYYRRLLRNRGTDDQTKVFLREKMQRAINFLKAIKLRKSTLREITERIVKIQSVFFEKGFSHLVPLRLKDIAEEIGIHESTVSRAIQGKYISTPQGTIPYKSFFSTKLETTDGSLESQKSIMEKLKKLVETEDSKNPYSDQEIIEKFNAEGIKIARRTVAKYRSLLRILPSHLRKTR